MQYHSEGLTYAMTNCIDALSALESDIGEDTFEPMESTLSPVSSLFRCFDASNWFVVLLSSGLWYDSFT